MEFHGSNEALGGELVQLTDRRRADLLIQPTEEQPLFPNGLAGLVPVRTQKANGDESLTYVFPFGEGLVNEYVADDEDIPVVTATAEQQPVLDALLAAVDLINDLLGQASSLAKYNFGRVYAVQIGVTQLGVGFTRVEPFPADRDKAQADVALTLHIETTDAMPGTTESFSAVVDYDCFGDPMRIAMLEYTADGYVFRAAANIDETTGELCVSKVEYINRSSRSVRLLYKRGLEKRMLDRDDRRSDRRGSSRDDRRGGRYERDDHGRSGRGRRGRY